MESQRISIFCVLALMIIISVHGQEIVAGLSEQEIVNVAQGNAQVKINALELLNAKEFSILSDKQMESYLSEALVSDKISTKQMDSLIQNLASSTSGLSFINSKKGLPIMQEYLKSKAPLSFGIGFSGFSKIENGIFYPDGLAATPFSLDNLKTLKDDKSVKDIVVLADGSLSIVTSGFSIIASNAVWDKGMTFKQGLVSYEKGFQAFITDLGGKCRLCSLTLNAGRVLLEGDNIIVPGGDLFASGNDPASLASAEVLPGGSVRTFGPSIFKDDNGVSYKLSGDAFISIDSSDVPDPHLSKIIVKSKDLPTPSLFITAKNSDSITVDLSEGSYSFIESDSASGKIIVSDGKSKIESLGHDLKLINGQGFSKTLIHEFGTRNALMGNQFGIINGKDSIIPAGVIIDINELKEIEKGKRLDSPNQESPDQESILKSQDGQLNDRSSQIQKRPSSYEGTDRIDLQIASNQAEAEVRQREVERKRRLGIVRSRSLADPIELFS